MVDGSLKQSKICLVQVRDLSIILVIILDVNTSVFWSSGFVQEISRIFAFITRYDVMCEGVDKRFRFECAGIQSNTHLFDNDQRWLKVPAILGQFSKSFQPKLLHLTHQQEKMNKSKTLNPSLLSSTIYVCVFVCAQVDTGISMYY